MLENNNKINVKIYKHLKYEEKKNLTCNIIL